MYLKKLEIAGFKSFADRTELEFVPGITAVVGPNGSGKSNVTDAIRWVLGEQSAKSLRGAKMEDIIFAGSDSRKPVNFAEVSLTLDNHEKSIDIEYSEVTISRRVFRSGESEYYINNQPCRLKDITELLMDTGVGKEAYSIIGQGKIEEILSSKPEERRGVFEEAAGIVKYKTRKREATKKLEETEQNLIRIRDLISELEGQIEPLENQALKAKEYKELATKLKELNIQIYVHDIENAYSDWQNTEQLKNDLVKEQLDLSSKVNQADSIIEQKKWVINQLEKELEGLNQDLFAISERVEQAEGKREVLREREKNHHANKSQFLQNIDKLLVKKSDLSSHLEDEVEKLASLEQKIKEVGNRLIEEQDTLEILLTDYEAQIELYKTEYVESLNEIATLRNEIRHISNSRQNITYRTDKLKIELEKMENEKEDINNRQKSLTQDIDEMKMTLQQVLKDYNEHVLAEKEDSLTKETLQNELRQLQQKLNSLLSKHEVLSEMQSDFSGFNQGVKEILKKRDNGSFSGINGAVAELITVKKDHETAIEIALGGSLQFVVVEKESVGRQAISFLKENRIGRATFLPMDVIKGKKLSQYDLAKIETLKGYVGVASDLITYDSSYTAIIESLLGQVIVVSELKVANEVARILGYTKKIVTIDGDVVNPGGAMTGGSIQKKAAGLLGRQREIEELSVEINSTKNSIFAVQEKITKLETNLENRKEQIEITRNKGERTRLKEQELQGKLQQVLYEYKTITDKITVLTEEMEMLQQDFQISIRREEELKKDLDAAGTKEINLQDKITRLETTRKQDETTKQEMNHRITSLKIELARYEQEKNGSNTLIERLTTDLNEIINTIEQNQHSLVQLENDLSTQLQNQDDISKDIEDLRYEKDKLQKEIEEKRLHRSKYVQEIDTEEIDTKELRKKLKTVEAGIHQFDVKLNRLNVELDNILKQLSDEYEMSYEWAKQYVERVEDINKAKLEVREYKGRVQALGDVNLGAIEEYDRVSERFTFLTSQRDDLVIAKETLYQVIQEVDGEMSKRFKESFDAIREHFQIIFTKLFGGGRADLILTNQDDLLETGVDIVAQPPGKKLQNLALLSGGEKALTAITLLFAILRVRPVPFCVLDEVEAALDEANVSRFSDYLREFCQYTQFIVVTHRKGTMEGSDVLYGITMQESGVSRLVSVKLEEKEKVAQMA